MGGISAYFMILVRKVAPKSGSRIHKLPSYNCLKIQKPFLAQGLSKETVRPSMRVIVRQLLFKARLEVYQISRCQMFVLSLCANPVGALVVLGGWSWA